MSSATSSSSSSSAVPSKFIRSRKENVGDHFSLLTKDEFFAQTTKSALQSKTKNSKKNPYTNPTINRILYLEPLENYVGRATGAGTGTAAGVEGDSVYFRQFHLRLVSYLGLFRDRAMPSFTSDTSETMDTYGFEWFPFTHWIDFDVIDHQRNEFPLRMEFSSCHYIADFYGRNLYGNVWHRLSGELVASLNRDKKTGKWIEGETNTEIGNLDEDEDFELKIGMNLQSETFKRYIPHPEGASQYPNIQPQSYNQGRTVYVHEYENNHDIEKAIALIMNVRIQFTRASAIFTVNHPMKTRVQYRTALLKNLFPDGVEGVLNIISEYSPADLPIITPSMEDTPEYHGDRENAEQNIEEDEHDDEEEAEDEDEADDAMDEDGDDG